MQDRKKELRLTVAWQVNCQPHLSSDPEVAAESILAALLHDGARMSSAGQAALVQALAVLAKYQIANDHAGDDATAIIERMMTG